MRTVYCLNNISKKGTELLPSDYALADSAEGAAGILVRSADMHETTFDPELRAIARAGAGVNNIPLERAAEEGIVVFNTPGANANAVKELVLCALLLGSRGIVEGAQWCRDNAADPAIAKSAEKAKKAFAGQEIMGKKLGVVGLGAIGAEVANAAIGLGMEVYGFDPYVSVGAAWRLNSDVHYAEQLGDLMAVCDYITIHVPAMESTKKMVGAEMLAKVKPGCIVLNFSRDTLVDNEAMAAALADGRVRRYVTDFATPEVMAMENAIVLPHLGASTEEAEDNCAVMAVQELVDYLDNGNIRHSVNYPDCDMGVVPEGLRRIAVLHGNTPGALMRITQVFGNAGVNIENVTNKAKGQNAYTLIDVDAGNPGPPDDAIDQLKAIEGVRRVRIVR